MTLTAHAIVGAGIAATMPAHPALGIGLAFASHFLVDAIPHYDYQIRSDSIHPLKGGTMRLDRALFADLLAIGSDFALGMLLSLFFFATPAMWPFIAAAALAAVLPDALQFVYLKTKVEPLVSLQKFHHWIHTAYHLREYPVSGAASQVAFLAAYVELARFIS